MRESIIPGMAKPGSDKFGRFQKRQAPEAEKIPESEVGDDFELGQERDFGREEQSPDQVSRMQRQLGNQAVLDVVSEEGMGEEVEGATREESRGSGMSSTQTGLPMVHDASGDLDWDQLWGGDDDDDAPPPPRRRPKASHRTPMPSQGAEDREVTPEKDVAYAREAPAVSTDALWRWLGDPEAACDPAPQPEDLLNLDRTHPLARCQTAGAFLAASAHSPLARALGELAGPLPTGQGLAVQVARAAALVGAAIAAEGSEDSTGANTVGVNRAVAVALEDDARPRVEGLAPWVSKQKRLAAHLLFEACAEDEIPDPPRPVRQAHPALLEAALRIVARPWPIPDPPRYPTHEAPQEEDPDLALLDMILRQATGGTSSALVDPTALKGVQSGAWALLERAGMAQRELAATGVAAWRIAGEPSRGRIMAIMRASDEALRNLAKTAYFAGRKLEELEGMSLIEARPILDQLEAALADSAGRLRRLRDSAFSAVARVASGGEATALSERGQAAVADRSAVRRVAAREPEGQQEITMIAALKDLRNGGLPLVELRQSAAADGHMGWIMTLLLAGVLEGLNLDGADLLLPKVIRESAELEAWPMFTAASLMMAAQAPETEREAIEAALSRVEAAGDPGVLLQARLLELTKR